VSSSLRGLRRRRETLNAHGGCVDINNFRHCGLLVDGAMLTISSSDAAVIG
jgi:hypothetical protein